MQTKGLLKLVINDSLLFPSSLYLLHLLKPLYRLPIDGNLFYPHSDIKKFITILSNEQPVDTSYTFTNDGHVSVKIYSVTLRVLVSSSLIVLTSVYAYIQLLFTLNWKGETTNIFKYGFIPHFQAFDIYVQSVLSCSFCCS